MIVSRSCCVSRKTPRAPLEARLDGFSRSCAATSAAWRPSAFSVSSRADCRTSTAAMMSVTAIDTTTATAIAANSRARSDLTSVWSPASRCRTSRDRLVAGPAHRSDQVGSVELAPQMGDVDVDLSRPSRVVEAPDALQQHGAGEDDPAVLHQVGEQVDLLGPQLDRLAGDEDLAGAALEDDVAEHEPVLFGVRL